MVVVYIFNQQITASENIPPQRREVLIGGNGIVFTYTVALRRNKINHEKHIFNAFHGSSNTYKDI